MCYFFVVCKIYLSNRPITCPWVGVGFPLTTEPGKTTRCLWATRQHANFAHHSAHWTGKKLKFILPIMQSEVLYYYRNFVTVSVHEFSHQITLLAVYWNLETADNVRWLVGELTRYRSGLQHLTLILNENRLRLKGKIIRRMRRLADLLLYITLR